MSRFVAAISVACGDRHTITHNVDAINPSAAAGWHSFVKATQGRSTVALAPLSFEQGVVGSAGLRYEGVFGMKPR